tara:strand:- start:280 stop:864 length:585 start_codon:yes stop_codon:yes gene_type:complete
VRVLIGCEESQEVCKAFRAKGHEAYSCDLQESSGGHPEWHIQGDVLGVLDQQWDLAIFHPTCTYLSNAGARWLYPKKKLDVDRLYLGLQAKKFFLKLYNADIDKICVENPIPSTIYKLPEYTQCIQPFEHGHPFRKKTCLWLKGLPEITPTNLVSTAESTKIAGNWFNAGGKDRQKNRSKTFPGIAAAMADQWG